MIAAVDISSSASGSLQTTAALADSADAATTVSTTATVSITAPPVLHIATSGTPSGAAAGTTYGLTLVPSLGGSPSGPAYHDPILTATLPSGETSAAAPSVIGWSCALSSGDTVLTCISTAAPIPAGTSLADLTATVDIASSAAGSLQTSATPWTRRPGDRRRSHRHGGRDSRPRAPHLPLGHAVRPPLARTTA